MNNADKGRQLSFKAAEAYKLLRSNLEYSLRDNRGCRVVGVTGARRQEGRTTTAVNLADALAQDGKRVLLVDADLRRSSAANRVGIAPDKGLAEILSGSASPREAVTEAGGFSLIAGGVRPDNPSELLGSDAMGRLMADLRQEYDYILLDLPPVTAVSDALCAARHADGMLLVVRRGHTCRRELDQALGTLRGQHVNVLGFVLND